MQNDKFGPPPQAYPPSANPPQAYPPQAYPPQAYPPQAYPPQVYPAQPSQPENPSYTPAYPQYPPPYQSVNYGPGPNPGPDQGPNLGHNPGINQPPQVEVNRPPVPNAPQSSGWFSRNQRNKPQSNAISSACMIFFSGGMNIAAAIQLWTLGGFYSTTHMRISWFIGAIIGAIIAALIVKILSKRIIILAASILVMVGGIVLAATRYNKEAIIASRYLDGIGNGLVFAPILSLTGEIVVKSMRGLVASSSEQMSFALGIFIQMLYSSSWTEYNAFTEDQLQGILSMIYGLIAFFLALFLMIESPVALLVKGQEQEAIEILRLLQRPSVTTTETYQILDEHKQYVAENNTLSYSQSAFNGLPALLRLCLFRALNAMNFSMIVSIVLFISSISSYYVLFWPFIVYGCLRWFGSLISVFMVDCFGRRIVTLVGFFFCFGLSIAVGVIFKIEINNSSITTVLMGLLFAHTFFGGFVASASSAYLTEAFPLAMKPYFITVTFIVEMLIHIIICSVDIPLLVTGISAYFFVLGGFSFVYFAMSIYNMPETKRTTLREAQEKFRTFVS